MKIYAIRTWDVHEDQMEIVSLWLDKEKAVSTAIKLGAGFDVDEWEVNES